ncbi:MULTISPECIES: CreA family protein [Burkholderia]|uniref:CreA family protein n=1 Tax=Burkholderia TaxID=32008 RepID=UPI00075D02CF|nr:MULTISPECIES: CreA family protein [Burkholderia]AOI99813.1 CreA family protein [Burkholderia sp. LA-2-3-30-S1-D2]KVE15524.1 CreA family protein [Burkholderia sp. LA-2-3-30-S1-D2]
MLAMITLRTRTWIASVALAISCASVVDAEELARIPPHSQRYGAHIGISAYDDPKLHGVTCFVSEPHTRDERPPLRDGHGAGASVSCHQTGTLATTARLPRLAQVFDESVDPVFGSIHVVRIVDLRRLVVVYFSYMESDVAGDLPGHVDVVRLPVHWGGTDASAE